ncbi:MAG: Ig-like domain-containing protein [Xenococcaceae cyanobacterium]
MNQNPTQKGTKKELEMFRKTLLVLTLVLMTFGVACAKKDTTPPRVVKTFPQNESQEVDPSLEEIAVVFNEEMMDQNWSWAYEDKNKFPQITGQAYYTENNTKNILPVKLEPNKEYVIWINTSQFKNFKDKSGNSAVPFKFTFKTN